jgi:hypothetical protein
MHRALQISTFILLSIVLFSCAGNTKLLGTKKVGLVKYRFFADYNDRGRSSIRKVYARVDSADITTYYSFYPNGIVVKVSETAKQVSLTGVYDSVPEKLTRNSYRLRTPLDVQVLSKADSVLSLLNIYPGREVTGVAAFQEEIYVLHGWPKGRPFRPL